MYRKAVLVSLILVYIVIIAGAVVRMTGSGMGCPDWPKCFGHIIPPTEESELLWQPNKNFEEGQVIILDNALRMAKTDFTTGNSFDGSNWSFYEKHDYAIFNPWHTWIEYLNRLLGVLAGFAVLIMAVLSFKYWKKSKRITLLSWFSVFLMGLQGWIGATVVYSVLAPARITLHMVIALLIVSLLIYLIYSTKRITKGFIFNKKFKIGIILALILSLVQIILGTQVRQFVDDKIDIVGYGAKYLWLENPEFSFYFHRTFSLVVLAINVFLFMQNRRLNLGHKLMNWILILLGLEILTGILMAYFDFPFLTQPSHLIIASLLFGIHFYIVLTSLKEKQSGQLANTA